MAAAQVVLLTNVPRSFLTFDVMRLTTARLSTQSLLIRRRSRLSIQSQMYFAHGSAVSESIRASTIRSIQRTRLPFAMVLLALTFRALASVDSIWCLAGHIPRTRTTRYRLLRRPYSERT